MNKKDMASRFTSDEEEILALCRVIDKYDTMRNGGYMTSTGFLSDRMCILAERALAYIGAGEEEWFFDGGYDTASRRVLVFLPPYMTKEDALLADNSSLRFVRLSYYKDYSLTHRDFLGALTGDGISRDAIGDILVNDQEKRADIVITEGILGYMLTSFSSVGRAKVEACELTREQLYIPEQKTEIIKDTVASLRLDAVISSALGISRDKAATAVERGLVELNHFLCQKGEKILTEGDAITVRGFGKFILSQVGNLSKKGRIFIEIKRFV